MRWTYLCLALGLAFALAACGDEKTDDTTVVTASQEETLDEEVEVTTDKTPDTNLAEEITAEEPVIKDAEVTDEAPEVAEIGKPVRTFKLTDLDGKAFDLASPGFTQDEAKAAVAAAAKAHELGTEDFANAAGMHFGLQASEEAAATLKTEEAAVDWIMKGKDQPILFMVWSPKCPTSKKYNDRINELVQASGVRMYAVDGNFKDEAKHVKKFADKLGFPVRTFMDKDLVAVDILGGKRTPHFMLVDTKGILRYRGGFDNDPQEMMEDGEREDWLKEAIAAVQAGKDVAKTETQPFG